MEPHKRRERRMCAVPFRMWLTSASGEIIDLAIRAQNTDDAEARARAFEGAMAAAYLGHIEDDSAIFDPGSTRQGILQFFRQALTEEQYFTVETVAVPHAIRAQSATALERLVRLAPDLQMRTFAVVWLSLIGWCESDGCTFGAGTWDQSVVLESLFEEVAPDRRAVDLALHRLARAGSQYANFGPPPLHLCEQTLGRPPSGWTPVEFIVPSKLTTVSERTLH